MTSRTSAPVRISTPRRAAAVAIACVMAPMPPMAWPQAPALAVHLAEAMVQQHIGRARRRRRRVGADDAVEGEGGLDDVALEPAVEKIGGAVREEVEQRALVVERRAEHAPPERRP